MDTSERRRRLGGSLEAAIITARDAHPRHPDDIDSWSLAEALITMVEAYAREQIADAFDEYADNMTAFRLSRHDEIENMRDVARRCRAGEYVIASMHAARESQPEEGKP